MTAASATACNGDNWHGQSEPLLTDPRDQIIDPQTAYQIVSLLQGVVQRGTGRSILAVGKPLAGKTGTSNDAKDLWFVGFSPDLACGVYVGFDNPRTLGKYEQGATVAAPIFRDFMEGALADAPPTPFRPAPGIELVTTNAITASRRAPAIPTPSRRPSRPAPRRASRTRRPTPSSALPRQRPETPRRAMWARARADCTDRGRSLYHPPCAPRPNAASKRSSRPSPC